MTTTYNHKQQNGYQKNLIIFGYRRYRSLLTALYNICYKINMTASGFGGRLIAIAGYCML